MPLNGTFDQSLTLKGDSINFNVCLQVVRSTTTCVEKKNSIKPFLAPEEAERNVIHFLQ